MPRQKSQKRGETTELEKLRAENRRLREIVVTASGLLRTLVGKSGGKRPAGLRVFRKPPVGGPARGGGPFPPRTWVAGPPPAVLDRIVKPRKSA
jgi:hypothetical protein